jgi:hypothetical protein
VWAGAPGGPTGTPGNFDTPMLGSAGRIPLLSVSPAQQT